MDDLVQDIVKDYYGKTLQSSSDLKTDACSTLDTPPAFVSEALATVHNEVCARYYGCGLAIPNQLDGLKVLDLGSGAGRDVFALAKLVGSNGHVTGVDMTPEQLDIARQYEDWHRQAFGYERANTRFIEGYLENLNDLDLEPASFDLIISNCVINLCANKKAVFDAAYALLKEGGELYFSDVYADRRMPQDLKEDPVLYGECLSGALYWNDFQSLAKGAGFIDPRIMKHRRLAINDKALASRVEPIKFASVTARLFKLSNLDENCENYGQAVSYNGGVLGMEQIFHLDAEHAIEKDQIFPVCRNSLQMLTQTRFAPYFQSHGHGDRHMGVFEGCAQPDVFADTTPPAPGGLTVSSCC